MKGALPAAGTLLVVALLLLSPGIALQNDPLQAAGLDLFQAVPPAAMTFETGCEGGRFVVEEGFFRFEGDDSVEDTPSLTGLLDLPSGYLDSGCGWARAPVTVPVGLDHMHVRFYADREVQVFEVPGPLSPGGDGFVQEVWLVDDQGRQLFAVPYFATNEPAREEAFHDLPSADDEMWVLARNTRDVEVVFFFDDHGYFLPSDSPNPASGESYASTVRDVEVEFSLVPTNVTVQERTVHQGIETLEELRVRVQVDEETLAAYGVHLRVLVQDVRFSHMILPDGTHFDLTGTRRAEGPHGFDPELVLVERFQGAGIEQVTVPRGITTQAGHGEYVLVFESIDIRTPSPLLAAVAFILLAMPLPFAAVAAASVRRFEREAFGDLQRSARALFWALLVAVAFYLTVIFAALLGGRLAVMATPPLGVESAFLYVQIAIAGGAFIALWRSAHHLYLVTKPKPLPVDSGVEG